MTQIASPSAPGADGSPSGRPRFSDLRLRTKLLALALAAALVSLTIGVVAQASLSMVQDTSRAIVVSDAKPALLLSNANAHWARYRQAVLNVVAAPDAASIRTASAALADEQAKVDAALAQFSTTRQEPVAQQKLADLKASYAKAVNIYDTKIKKAAETTTDPQGIIGIFAVVGQEFSPVADSVSQGFDDLADALAASIDAALTKQSDSARAATVELWAVAIVGSLAVVLLGLWIGAMVTRPILRVREALKALAAGDLTAQVDVRSRDEVGEMAAALTAAQTSLREAMSTIGISSATLAGSAEELSAVSSQVAASAEETSAQSGTAASAAEQVSRNVQTVAAATEQMTASIREISQSSSDAVRVAQSAAIEAQQANATVAKLGDSSREIGDVVKVITSIAEQTNLLALNATIEAARAGEAGKGFAVVASEVKDLAQETARATDDISRRIDAIQNDTEEAVAAIGRIATIIDEVNNYQTTIASAVEEQTATTTEMSRNVTDAATGSSTIAQNIERVATSAQSSSTGIGEAQRAASELAQLSGELRELVGRFRV